ncbi:MAG: acyltransferase [Pseudomonadota bacterium]
MRKIVRAQAFVPSLRKRFEGAGRWPIFSAHHFSDISNGRDNNLHLIRLLAAYAVLFGHCWPLLAGPAVHDPLSEMLRSYSPFQRSIPGIAVYTFFFLSGFLVTRSMVLGRGVASYLLSRALRIYPALIIVIGLLVFVLGPIMTSLSLEEYFSKPLTWKYLKTNIVMWNVEFRLPGVFSDNAFKGVNGSLWTLPAEIRCYALVLLFWILGVFSSRTIFNTVAIGCLIGGYLFKDHLLFFSMKGHVEMAFFFLLGSAVFVNRDAITLSVPILGALIFLALMLHGQPLYHLAAGLALSMGILYTAFVVPCLLPQLNRFGDISYGVYIYAYPVQQIIIEAHSGEISPLTLAAYATPIVLVCATLSWFLIERPCLNLKAKLLR